MCEEMKESTRLILKPTPHKSFLDPDLGFVRADDAILASATEAIVKQGEVQHRRKYIFDCAPVQGENTYTHDSIAQTPKPTVMYQ